MPRQRDCLRHVGVPTDGSRGVVIAVEKDPVRRGVVLRRPVDHIERQVG